MPEKQEGRTAEDPRWNGAESGSKHKTRYERIREAYDQAEREGTKNGQHPDSHYYGECKNILQL